MTIISETKDAFVGYIKTNGEHLLSVLDKDMGDISDDENKRKRKVILSVLNDTISEEELDKLWEKSIFFPKDRR